MDSTVAGLPCLPCGLSKAQCDRKRPCIECLMRSRAHLCRDRTHEYDDPQKLSEFSNKLREPRKRKADAHANDQLETPDDKKRDAKVVSDQQPMPLEIVELTWSIIEPVLTSVHDSMGPFFDKDLDFKKEAWRRWLTLLNMWHSTDAVDQARQILIKEALRATKTEEGRQRLLEFSEAKPYKMAHSSPKLEEKFNLHAHEEQTIQELFNVKDIHLSDLALARTQHILHPSDECHVESSLNVKAFRLLGIPFPEGTKDSNFPVQKADLPFWFHAMAKSTADDILRFTIASLLCSHAQIAQTFELKDLSGGPPTKVFGLFLASEVKRNEKVEVSWLMVLKPMTRTFNPELYTEFGTAVNNLGDVI